MDNETSQQHIEKITEAEAVLETKLNEYEGEMPDEAKKFLGALGKTTGAMKEIIAAGLIQEETKAKLKEFYDGLDEEEKVIFSNVLKDC